MEEINLVIEKDLSKYAQCNFCLGSKDVYTVRGDRLRTVMSVCKKCSKKINKVVK